MKSRRDSELCHYLIVTNCMSVLPIAAVDSGQSAPPNQTALSRLLNGWRVSADVKRRSNGGKVGGSRLSQRGSSRWAGT